MKKPPQCVYDSDHAVFFEPATGRVFATIWHDGYGKYYPTLFLSPLAAFRHWRDAVTVTFKPLPRIALDCIRLKCDKMEEAVRIVENVLLN